MVTTKDPENSDDFDRRLWRGKPEDREHALRSRGTEIISRTTIESAMTMLRPGSGSTDVQVIDRFRSYLQKGSSKRFSRDGLCAYAQLFMDEDDSAVLHELLLAIVEFSHQDPQIWSELRPRPNSALSWYVMQMLRSLESGNALQSEEMLKLFKHALAYKKAGQFELRNLPPQFKELLVRLDKKREAQA